MGSTYAAIGPQPQAGGRHALQWIRPKYRFGFAFLRGRNAANRRCGGVIFVYLLTPSVTSRLLKINHFCHA